MILHTVRRHCDFYSLKLTGDIRNSLQWVEYYYEPSVTMNGNKKRENFDHVSR